MSQVESFDYGEPVVGAHPWVRCIGDSIVRYVHPVAEDPAITLLREIDSPILPHALERYKNQLETEITELSSAGVPVVKSTVEVCPIPVFARSGEVTDHHLGLQINSDYVYGISLLHYEPPTEEERRTAIEKLNETCNGISGYLVKRKRAGVPMLKDIYTDNQFFYGAVEPGGEPNVMIVDLDPYFMSPSDDNFYGAAETLVGARDYLIRQLKKHPLPHPDNT